MGGGNATAAHVDDQKEVRDDRPLSSAIYDYATSSDALPIPSGDLGYESFKRDIAALFLKPPTAVRELCETEGHYNLFLKEAAQENNPYQIWLQQCYAHIKKGDQVGLPYLKRKDGTANLPPLRYRHMKNCVVNGQREYSSTMVLTNMIRLRYGNSLSNDACNVKFDEFIRSFPLSAEDWQTFSKVFWEAASSLATIQQDLLKSTNESYKNTIKPQENLNEDQDYYCDEIISDLKIQKIWGKAGHMKRAFPTMWFRFKNNLHGDGTKKDPTNAPFGFPRFHEDFSTKKSNVFFRAGLTSTHDRPSDKLMKSTWECFGRFGQENYDVQYSDAKFKQIADWLKKDNNWNDMQSWLINNEPQILFFYYTQWSEYDASKFIQYSTITVFHIFRHVAIWMTTPIGKESVVRWKNSKDLAIKDMPRWQWLSWLPIGQKIERTNNNGQLITRYFRDSNEQVTILLFNPNDPKAQPAKEIVNIKLNTQVAYDEKGIKKAEVEYHKDESKTVVAYDIKGNKEASIEVDKDGTWLSVIDASWNTPNYKIQLINPKLIISPKMLEIRQAWMDSHISTLGFDGTDWLSVVPTYTITSPAPSDLTTLPPLEYNKYIFNFIKKNPLPKPSTPGIFQDPKYRTIAKDLVGPEAAKSCWQKACEVQWTFYLIWVESNVNAQGKPNYVKPGQAFPKPNDKGQTVVNCYPNTGILAIYDGHEGGAKVFHVLTLGLTVLFGDTWWSEVVNALLDTFNWVIQFLRDHLPEIGIGLLVVGAAILGFYGLSQFLGEESRQLAH